MQLRELEASGEGAVRRLRLSGHPLGSREAAELSSVARELAEDPAVRVVVLETRLKDFCPGPAEDLDSSTLDPPADLARIRAPVVAALRGSARSVGLEIALAADIRIAAQGASMSMPDVQAGCLPCWGGTQRLVRAAGAPAALEMLLLGAEVDADRALTLGLVNEVVRPGSLSARTDEIIRKLLELGPLALQYAKEAVREGAELPFGQALHLEGDFNHILQASRDRAEGIEAFLRKRPPKFEGR
jgi:enoyl-CoA hydratase